ncbi:MAG TPA: 6,7-dimethyl-8-ribityllumazine synthase [Candidatus Deferrimicrobium sp.]|nr:6,7-dimethyl-8-ribityllumazine synthase [Candidatus Deferrimicrobium sp.]
MEYKVYAGKLDARGFSFGLIVSRFNSFLTDKLLEGAIDCLKRHGAEEQKLSVAYVPGAFEIPYVAARMAKVGTYDAVICLGALIRGETPHFDYIANEASKGIARIALDTGVPVIYGLVTADTLEQAIERSGTKAGNKGWQAAEAAIEMINLYRALG